MMSLPFQQTARYLLLYQQEITPEERAAIEAVLGDVGTVADKYDPASADPVKALFHLRNRKRKPAIPDSTTTYSPLLRSSMTLTCIKKNEITNLRLWMRRGSSRSRASHRQ